MKIRRKTARMDKIDAKVTLGERYGIKVRADSFNNEIVGGTYIGKKQGYSYFKLDNGKFAYWTNRGNHRMERLGENIYARDKGPLITEYLEEMREDARKNIESLLSKLEKSQQGALQNA